MTCFAIVWRLVFRIIVLNNKFTEHFSAQILIGHNEAELKIGAFSLGMSLYYLKIYYVPILRAIKINSTLNCFKTTTVNIRKNLMQSINSPDMFVKQK